MKFLNFSKKRLIGTFFVLAIIGLPGPIPAMASGQTQELQQRGVELRATVEQIVVREKDRPLPDLSRRVEEVSKQYIPTGMEFERAELLLRSAGFRLQIQENKVNRLRYRVYVLPNLNKTGRFLVTSGTLYVFLYPETEGKFKNVRRIVTEYSFIMP